MAGNITQPIMNTNVLKFGEKEFCVIKMYQWFNLLENGMMPTVWHEPTEDGTVIDYVDIEDEATKEQAKCELKLYIDEINKKYDLDFGFKIED